MSSVPERLKSLEVNQDNFLSVFEKFTENTDKSFKGLTEQGSEIAVALVQIAATNSHLEKAFVQEMESMRETHTNEMLSIRKDQTDSQLQIEGVIFRVSQIEVARAKEDGYKTAKNETKSFYLTNWFNIVKFIMGLSTAIGAAYYVANHLIKV